MNPSLSLTSPATVFQAFNGAKQRKNSGNTRGNLIILYQTSMLQANTAPIGLARISSS
jgi:hypothetical protein